MEKKLQQAGWWSLIMAGLAGAAYLPYRSVSVPPTERPGALTAQSQAGDGSRDAQPSDALTVVGQYFGIDVSEAGLRRRVLAAGSRFELSSNRTRLNCPAPKDWSAPLADEQREICEDYDTLAAFFELDIDPKTPKLARARSAFKTLVSCVKDGDPTACRRAAKHRDILRPFLRSYLDEEALRVSNPPLPERRTATEFSRLNRTSLAQLQVSHVARRTGTELSFLVATVPDGVDSYAGWSFDPATDAIRRAAERAGYVIDRFFLPDWSNRGSGGALGRTHEEQPGAMLFRDRSRGKDGLQSLLVVLLALETPTTGVHAVAMDRALRLAGWWQGPGAHPELRVLGPFYSGTTSSLERSLHRVLPSLDISEVRIISGSATSLSNQSDLEDLDGTKYATKSRTKVRFKATTLPDNRCDLRKALHERFDVARMAWLTESNTVYGRSQLSSGEPSVQNQPVSTATPAGGCRYGSEDVNFTFPLHISRLRDLSSAAPPDRHSLGVVLPLVLREAFTPSDTFPSLSPTLTSATTEIMLRNLGRLVSREKIRVVGITATDARDKLFLARAIRRMHPSVSFVTTEANILYSHPDYSDSVRGMLVASAYPLASFVGETVREGEPDPGRVLFSTAAAEGIYNAALVQMSWARTPAQRSDNTSASERAPNQESGTSQGPAALYAWSGERMPFIYSREFTPTNQLRRPSVWLSLVGREDAWPLAVSGVDTPSSTDPGRSTGSRFNYTFGAPNSPSKRNVEHELLRVHTAMVFGYLLFSIIAFLHIVAFVFGWPGYLKRLMIRTPPREAASDGDITKPSARSRKNRAGRYRRQFACFASLTIVYTTCAVLQMVWSRELGGLAAFIATASGVIVALLMMVSLATGLRLLPTVRGRQKDGGKRGKIDEPDEAGKRRGARKHRIERAIYSGVLIAAGGSCVVLWTLYVIGLFQTPQPYGGLIVERYARVSNGLSPVLPLLFLASAVYIWGFLDLTSHPTPVNRRFNDSLELLNRLTDAAEDEIERERAGVVTARLVAVLVVVGWLTLLIGLTPVFSFEGPLYGCVYTSVILLLHALVVAKLIAVWYRWGVLAKHLDTLAKTSHPIVKLIASRTTSKRDDSGKKNPETLILTLHDSPPDTGGAGAAGAVIRVAREAERPKEELSLPEFNATLLFRGPRLDEVETLCREYETTVCTLPERVRIRKALEEDKKDERAVSGANSFAWEALTAATIAAVQGGALGAAVYRPGGCLRADQDAIARFFALYLFSSIRMALWRIWRPLAFVISAILLITLSHLVYPIQPRTLLVGVAAAEVLVAAALAVRALLAVERNAILSRLTGGRAEQIDWSWRFAGRLAAWVALPIVGVVATRFPDIGDFVLKLFSPFEAFTR